MELKLAWSILMERLHARKGKKQSEVIPIQNVFVLRTHVLDDYVQQTFLRMQQQLGPEKIFILFDETNGKPGVPSVHWNTPEGVATGPAVITINESDCQQLNSLHLEGPESGSMHRVEAAVCACSSAIRMPFDYLWFIEYDVYCKDYRVLIQACDAICADILTSANQRQRLLTVRNKPKWHWWPSLFGEIAHTPMQQRRGCFFPINRFSRSFLTLLEQQLSKSSGYCEVYFPTLCCSSGMSVKLIPRWLFGIFRYKPEIAAMQIKKLSSRDFRLYHPVKKMTIND